MRSGLDNVHQSIPDWVSAEVSGWVLKQLWVPWAVKWLGYRNRCQHARVLDYQRRHERYRFGERGTIHLGTNGQAVNLVQSGKPVVELALVIVVLKRMCERCQIVQLLVEIDTLGKASIIM